MAAKRGESAGGNVDDERVVDREVTAVVVRSSPRYGRFLAIGVILGLVSAAVLTANAGLTGDPGGPMSSGPSGVLLVFGLYAAVCVGVGLVVMGTLALVLGSFANRRSRSAQAEHDTTLVMDLNAPVNDDVPVWVRDSDDLR